MNQRLKSIIVCLLAASFVVWAFQITKKVEQVENEQSKLGSTVSTISSSDLLSNFPSSYNTTIANLNADKLEAGSYAATLNIGTAAMGSFSATTTATSTIASSLLTGGLSAWNYLEAPIFKATSTTATSTFANGIDLSKGCFSINSVCVGGSVGGSGTVSSGRSSQLAWYDSDGTTVTGTSTNPLYIGTLFATSTTATSTLNATILSNLSGLVGIGTSSPSTAKLAVNGAILGTESVLSTSTSMSVSWRNGNQQVIRVGSAATTVTFGNYEAGQTLRLLVCNPNVSASTVTFTGVLWSGGTAPTHTTTADKCDIFTFIATQATTSLKIMGSSILNF